MDGEDENTPLRDNSSSLATDFSSFVSLEDGDLEKIGLLLRQSQLIQKGNAPESFVNDVLKTIRELEPSKKAHLCAIGNKLIKGEMLNPLAPAYSKNKAQNGSKDAYEEMEKMQKLPMPAPKDIGLLFDIYKAMPSKVKATLAQQVPSDYKKVLPMIEKIPTKVVVNVIPKAYKLMEDMAEREKKNLETKQRYMSLSNSDSNSKTAIELEESFSIDIATDIFEDIQKIPTEAREEMIQMIPSDTKDGQNTRDLVKHAMEATEGLNKNDIKEVLVTYRDQEKTKHENQEKLALLSGEEKRKFEKELTEKEQTEQFSLMKKLICIALKAQSRRLFSWMIHSPLSLRVLGFLSGLLLFVANIFAFLMNLFTGKFFAFCFSFWIFIFSVVILLVEIKLYAVEQYCLPYINQYFQFLGTMTGRGGFLVFTGLFSMSLIDWAKWQNYALFCAGAFTVFIGLLNIIVGNIAYYRFMTMKKKMTKKEKVQAMFDEADVDNSGELDMEELCSLCNKLGTSFDKTSLEIIIRSIDTDHNGTLSFEEFHTWWSSECDESLRKKIDEREGDIQKVTYYDSISKEDENQTIPLVNNDLKQIKEKAKNINRPPTILKLVNVLAALCAVTAGISGAILSFERIGFKKGFFPFLMNVWFAVAGIFFLMTESGIWCITSSPCTHICFYHALKCLGNSRSALTDHYFRVFDTIIGRAIFKIFTGTIGFTLYSPGVGKWQLYSVFTGLLLFVLGICNMIVGIINEAKLNAMRQRLQEGELRAAFDLADKDGSGELDMRELVDFCATLEIELNHGEWELLVDQLDRDKSGTISFEEFQIWWLHKLSN